MKTMLLISALGLGISPAYATCYDGPIEAFFPEFAASIAVQEAVTPKTIRYAALDMQADPEPVLIARDRDASDLEWPLVPNAVQFERSGGSITYTAGAKDETEVTLSGDSGYLMSLVFAASPCWQLTAVVDESM